MFRSAFLIALTSAALTLAACGSDNQPAASQAVSNTTLPSDPTLASLYQQSCMACHTRPATGAPQTGSAEDWEPRLAKGMDTLFENTINGYRGMPPLGSCMDCDETEFEALITFMATAE